MYLLKHFEQNDPALLLKVMRQRTLASLVSLVSLVDRAQLATHLPAVAG